MDVDDPSIFQLVADQDDSDYEFLAAAEENLLGRLSDQYVEYLKLIKDNWSSCHAAKVLSVELVRYIVPRFRQLSAPLRVRILTSFFYIRDSLRVDAHAKLLKLLSFTETDANEWVRKMGQLVKPFILNGMIDLRLIDTETAFRIITFLDEHNDPEAKYYAKEGLDSVHMCSINNYEHTHDSFLQKSSGDEYTQYYPQANFDDLGEAILRRADAPPKP
ncbi:EtCHP39 protein [Babesia caballi]|uniref:EtCHP39 protein n=1 Tax=Babesia caballi TaxID=5871 RepID=A0AAV4LZN6_BABCB|nr:EtCHP39 protein [Babesia caballi]